MFGAGAQVAVALNLRSLALLLVIPANRILIGLRKPVTNISIRTVLHDFSSMETYTNILNKYIIVVRVKKR